MNTIQTVTLFLSGIISLIFVLLVIQINNAKNKIMIEEKTLKLSFSIWNGAFFVGSSLIISKMLSLIYEAIIIHESQSAKFTNVLYTTSIFMGLTAIWILILFFIAKAFTIFALNSMNDKVEIEKNHWEYFVFKSLLLLGTIIGLMPVFEHLLKLFMPEVVNNLYH